MRRPGLRSGVLPIRVIRYAGGLLLAGDETPPRRRSSIANGRDPSGFTPSGPYFASRGVPPQSYWRRRLRSWVPAELRRWPCDSRIYASLWRALLRLTAYDNAYKCAVRCCEAGPSVPAYLIPIIPTASRLLFPNQGAGGKRKGVRPRTQSPFDVRRPLRYWFVLCSLCD